MLIRRFFLASLGIIAASIAAASPSVRDFFGADNQLGEISFKTRVEVYLDKGLTEKERDEKIAAAINLQSLHMFGSFTEHKKFRRNPGSIANRPKIEISKVVAPNVASGKPTVVHYAFADKVVFKTRLYRQSQGKLTFVLPKDPFGIYAATSLPIDEALAAHAKATGSSDDDLQLLYETGETTANLCTDLHYNTEDDFWYFWDVSNPGCQIADDMLVNVKANLKALPSTTNSFPDYDKILGDNGNGEELSIMYLVGIDANTRRSDLGRQTFENALELLRDYGFKLDYQQSRAHKKFLSFSAAGFTVKLQMHLADPDSTAFLRLARQGLEESDMFIYDGHSGLGEYLNSERFANTLGAPLKLPKDKSQIFYFNGCSTFSHYSFAFFDLKKTKNDPEGMANLDILTTTIAADFVLGPQQDVLLVTSLIDAKQPSWQKIIRGIYRVDPEVSALTHVIGDYDVDAKSGR